MLSRLFGGPKATTAPIDIKETVTFKTPGKPDVKAALTGTYTVTVPASKLNGNTITLPAKIATKSLTINPVGSAPEFNIARITRERRERAAALAKAEGVARNRAQQEARARSQTTPSAINIEAQKVSLEQKFEEQEQDKVKIEAALMEKSNDLESKKTLASEATKNYKDAMSRTISTMESIENTRQRLKPTNERALSLHDATDAVRAAEKAADAFIYAISIYENDHDALVAAQEISNANARPVNVHVSNVRVAEARFKTDQEEYTKTSNAAVSAYESAKQAVDEAKQKWKNTNVQLEVNAQHKALVKDLSEALENSIPYFTKVKETSDNKIKAIADYDQVKTQLHGIEQSQRATENQLEILSAKLKAFGMVGKPSTRKSRRNGRNNRKSRRNVGNNRKTRKNRKNRKTRKN